MLVRATDAANNPYLHKSRTTMLTICSTSVVRTAAQLAAGLVRVNQIAGASMTVANAVASNVNITHTVVVLRKRQMT